MMWLWTMLALPLVLSLAWAQPLDFHSALELSQQSPGVLLAQGQRDLAQKQLEVAQGILSGSLSAGYTKTWGESTTTISGVGQITSLDDAGFDAFNLNATLNVVPFGPNADAIQKARWSLEQAERNLRDAKAEAILKTVQAYLNFLRAQQSLELQALSVEVAAQKLEAANVRQESGSATQQQVLQAEIALAQAQHSLNDANRVLIQSSAALSNQLGVFVDSVDIGIPEPTMPKADLNLENRSDVMDARVAVLEAELNAESTKRQYLPSASLDVTYSSNDEENRFSFGVGYDTQSYQPKLGLSYDPSFSQGQGSSSFLSVTLGATIPIESSIFSALEAARLSIEQSKMQAQRTEELARLEIENAARQLEVAKAAVVLSEQLLVQSQQILDTARERFELGVITKLDVLEAENAFQEANLNLGKAKDQYLLSLLQYAQSLAIDLMEVFEYAHQ